MKKRVCVLMSTYNGEKFLREQIESILGQSGVDVSIIVRDDGSSDTTKIILEEYMKKGLLFWYAGENVGAAHSFIDLILYCSQEFDFYAFSDQDDVWFSEKLCKAVEMISGYGDVPVFYNSKAIIVDENLNNLGSIFGSEKVYNWETQIARSNVIGCTLVVNNNLMNILKRYRPNYVCMHDQWIAIVCKVFSGVEVKDNNAYMLYRQHGNNLIGTKGNISEKFKNSFINERTNCRQRQAREVLCGYSIYLDEQVRTILNYLSDYQKKRYYQWKCMVLDYNCEKAYLNLLIRLAFLFKRF